MQLAHFGQPKTKAPSPLGSTPHDRKEEGDVVGGSHQMLTTGSQFVLSPTPPETQEVADVHPRAKGDLTVADATYDLPETPSEPVNGGADRQALLF
jgi:hypothetical protein